MGLGAEHGNGKPVADVVSSAANRHIVIVPLPSQGHVTPSLQLAHHLVAVGFRITFVNTVYNHELMMKSRSASTAMGMVPHDKGIEFVSVPDGLPDGHPRYRKFEDFNWATLSMGPVFEELFVKLLRESPITCVIRDIRMSAVHDRAKKLGIPVVGFATPSAISAHCVFHLPTFLAAGMTPLPPPPAGCTPSLNPRSLMLGPPRSDAEAAARQGPVMTCVPGVSPTLRVEDIPTCLLTDLDHYFFRIHRQIQNPLLPDCDCILLNTFHGLEGEVLDAMTGHANSNVFAVGPLVLNSADGAEQVAMAGTGSALWEEDPVAMSWLDDQNPNSVLFVSFGSIATVSVEQMQELACGLEMSGHTFLWVIRSDSIENMCEDNKEFETMFSEFVIRTRHRGLLVPWAPQTAVLSHPSVAAFLTHCGWNSTIESIASGVPMLAWPRFGDQTTNCHYITHVWKVGLQLQVRAAEDGCGILPKEEVDQKVRKMMAKLETSDLEVAAIRTNSRNLEMAARKAVAKGGSSHAALAKFVEHIEGRSKHSGNAVGEACLDVFEVSRRMAVEQKVLDAGK